MGKVSGSAGGSNATESWLPSRAIGFMDERMDKNKILMVEYMATSDMKRRIPLGFWLLVGVLHTVSSFSFVESVSCLCCARGGGSRSLMLLKSLQSSVPMKSVNLCCVLGEAVAIVCAISQPLLCARGRQS